MGNHKVSLNSKSEIKKRTIFGEMEFQEVTKKR